MMNVKKLVIQNFLSIGNQPVEINLNQDNITLIHGVNGSGKSAILDALTYSLFGKPFRNIRLPQLLNTQNSKGLLTTIYFSIGSDNYVVRRGIKPKIFEIYVNDKKLDAGSNDKETQSNFETTILKMNFKSFTQIVILGASSFVPFMQLPAMGRRECVEEFLDIRIFSTMNVIAKERIRSLKEQVEKQERSIELCNYKLNLENSSLSDLMGENKNKRIEIQNEIAENQKEIEVLNGMLTDYTNHQSDLITRVQTLLKKKSDEKLKQLNKNLIQFRSRVDQIEKSVKFYSENDVCISCKQEITEEFKSEVISESTSTKTELNDALEKILLLMKKHQQHVDIIQQLQREIQTLNAKITGITTSRKALLDANQRLESRLINTSSNANLIAQKKERIKLLSEEFNKLNSDLVVMKESKENHVIALNLLKDDGIKSQIVKKYLPVMNSRIQHYLRQLDFPIHFSLDQEFNETVLSPIHQDFSYYSFSEGQKARINIALLLTWRDIAKIKNSVNCNLLFFDETFSSSLDSEGRELLLSLLKYKLENTNVFVVDHTLDSEFQEKFTKRIEVKMINGFSRYYL